MPAYLTDFQIGYNYARQRKELFAGHTPGQLLDIGRAFWFYCDAAPELSKGMGLFCLELCVQLLIEKLKELEETDDKKQALDC